MQAAAWSDTTSVQSSFADWPALLWQSIFTSRAAAITSSVVAVGTAAWYTQVYGLPFLAEAKVGCPPITQLFSRALIEMPERRR